MKITDLIDSLNNVLAKHGDLTVAIASDAEGNGFEMLSADHTVGTVDDDGEFSGLEDLIDEDEQPIAPEHVVLWP